MNDMSGGAKLDGFLRDIAKKARNAATLKVGFLSNAVYPDGTPVALVAATQEYGAPARGIPPRPFFRPMIRRYRGVWPSQIARLLKTTGMDAKATLTIMGQEIASELEQQIVETTSPPLSPVTLMLRSMRIGNKNEPVTFAMVLEARRRVLAGEKPKGLTVTGSRPLIDTGRMVKSVNFEIS